MNILTCVITFLNEHIEVFRTVKSIRDSVGDQVDIVLVNDCSEDGIEYKVIANQFNCKYVLNQHRQGVANSRDIGVMMAETDYCMILDAHMRFYDDTWLPRMIEEIDANPKRLYCTGCQALWWPLEEDKYQHVNLGAYLTFNFNNHYDSLEPKWTKTKNRPDGTEAIPIILGANYGFAKEYYAYIGGDDGLLMYGGDAAGLSLKSWALGDGCAILNDVIIGQVFVNATLM